jgi:twitching motility protein PilT
VAEAEMANNADAYARAPQYRDVDLDINRMLTQAVERRASDLHLQTGEKPDIRVDGDLKTLDDGYPVATQENLEKILMPLLTAAQREEFLEKWELDFSYSIEAVGRFRVNYHYQAGEMAAAFRHIPNRIPSLADIQAPFAMLDFARLERGLVLVTGPTGSGKSTTLAAMLDVINTERPCHILTLEDPIEFVHERKRALVKQREIGRDTKSFAESLKRALRQDPDVILVGEMRDPETTAIALTAAETGHLVLSTLHTRSAPSTVDRIIDQFQPEQQDQIRTQLAASLAGVVSQTLLPRADGEGRVAAHEVLVVTSAIENIIRKGQSEQLRTPLQTQADIGMQTMDKALVYLVQQGVVDLEVARRRSQETHEFDQLIEAYRQGRPVQTPRYVTPVDLSAGMAAMRQREQISVPVMRPPVTAGETATVALHGLCPLHDVPLENPLLFDERTGERYPPGTTHAICAQRVGHAAPVTPLAGSEERIMIDDQPEPAPMRATAPVMAPAYHPGAEPLPIPEPERPAAAPLEDERPAVPLFKPPTEAERARVTDASTDDDAPAPVPMRPR